MTSNGQTKIDTTHVDDALKAPRRINKVLDAPLARHHKHRCAGRLFRAAPLGHCLHDLCEDAVKEEVSVRLLYGISLQNLDGKGHINNLGRRTYCGFSPELNASIASMSVPSPPARLGVTPFRMAAYAIIMDVVMPVTGASLLAVQPGMGWSRCSVQSPLVAQVDRSGPKSSKISAVSLAIEV